MICDDIIFLVDENPAAHGIFEPHEETQRMVYCQVRSLSKWDYWRAKENGLNPQYTFRIDRVEYDGEKICIYDGVRYAIVRNMVVEGKDITEGEYIDLTCEPATVDKTYITGVQNNG